MGKSNNRVSKWAVSKKKKWSRYDVAEEAEEGQYSKKMEYAEEKMATAYSPVVAKKEKAAEAQNDKTYKIIDWPVKQPKGDGIVGLYMCGVCKYWMTKTPSVRLKSDGTVVLSVIMCRSCLERSRALCNALNQW